MPMHAISIHPGSGTTNESSTAPSTINAKSCPRLITYLLVQRADISDLEVPAVLASLPSKHLPDDPYIPNTDPNPPVLDTADACSMNTA
jgi:hypothetical protein